MRDFLAEGVHDLSRGRYYRAHELLEQHWRGLVGDQRRLVQALIQLAGACLHLERGRPAQAQTLLKRAAGKMAGLKLSYRGLAAEQVQESIAALQTTVAAGKADCCVISLGPLCDHQSEVVVGRVAASEGFEIFQKIVE